jgi:hypothetical protein
MNYTETNPRTAPQGNPGLLSEEAREREIERLATEIGRLIHQADAEIREELAESATALLREEGLRAGMEQQAMAQTAQLDARRERINPLAAGIGLMVVGAGLSLLVPFLGIALAAIGALAVIWGLILSWKRA